MFDYRMTYQIYTLVNGKDTEASRTAVIQASSQTAAQLEALSLVNDWNRAGVVTSKASGVLYHYTLNSVIRITEE